MAKVKVLVLYPTGFAGLGIDPSGSDVVEIDEVAAETLVGHGWAEYIKPRVAKAPTTKKTETAVVKLKDDS
jgi:hypothetical protein